MGVGTRRRPVRAQEGNSGGSLAVEGVTVRFGGNTALENVSLTAAPGEWIGLIGPNGAGKSTLVNCISGFARPSAGRILLNGTDLVGLRAEARPALGLGRTFQNLELAGTMTAAENVALAERETPAGTGRKRRRWAQRCESARRLLADVGFPPEASETKVAELPYGLRKLAELARALATQPDVLVMDEPVAGLGTADKALFVDRLREVLGARRITVLLVEHDMPTVERLCERVYVVVAGRSLVDGSFAEVSAHPEVIRAYLG
jgi:ABC-type branched-subunit amino acid transport system ATPase component